MENASESPPKFTIGQVVKHRMFPLQGRDLRRRSRVLQFGRVVRIDPGGNPSAKDQPFYHLLAETPRPNYVALRVRAETCSWTPRAARSTPPQIAELFDNLKEGQV
jgi:heat shock protein HspQ